MRWPASGRNQTKTLLGIETAELTLAVGRLESRNQTKTLLGIETRFLLASN